MPYCLNCEHSYVDKNGILKCSGKKTKIFIKKCKKYKKDITIDKTVKEIKEHYSDI